LSKGYDQAVSGLPIEADLAVLRPRLLPLGAEQQSEAVELLSGLLLAAVRRGGSGSGVPPGGADEGDQSRRCWIEGLWGFNSKLAGNHLLDDYFRAVRGAMLLHPRSALVWLRLVRQPSPRRR